MFHGERFEMIRRLILSLVIMPLLSNSAFATDWWHLNLNSGQCENNILPLDFVANLRQQGDQFSIDESRDSMGAVNALVIKFSPSYGNYFTARFWKNKISCTNYEQYLIQSGQLTNPDDLK